MNDPREAADPPASRTSQQHAAVINHEQIHFLLEDRLEDIRTSFAFYRQCTKLFLHTYNHDQTEALFTLVSDKAIRDRSQLCQLCAIGAISCLFGRETIPAEVGDQFYHAARFLKRACSLDSPLAGMRVCVLLGLFNLWNKSLEAIEQFDFGIGLARRLKGDTRFAEPHRDSETFRDIRRVWRSLKFGKSWMQATLGYVSNDDGLDYPLLEAAMPEPIYGPDNDELLAREIENITVLNAQGFRMLLLTSRPSDCLTEMERFNDLLTQWYSRLPNEAKVDRLNIHNGFKTTVVYYVHLQHLSAVMLIHRRAISSFANISVRNGLTDEQRQQLTNVLNEGVLAAKQAARILYLIVQEGRGLTHCWTLIYNAYVCGMILLHFTSQLQIHGYPESRWVPSINLAKNAISVLDYCRRLDPVARGLQRVLNTYLQKFDGLNTDFTWDLQEDMQQAYRDDMTDLLFSERMSHTPLAAVRTELQTLACQHFSGAPQGKGEEERSREQVGKSWQSLLPSQHHGTAPTGSEPARVMGWTEQRTAAECGEGATALSLVPGSNRPNNPTAM